MKTLYEQWLEIEAQDKETSEIEYDKLKFYFANSMAYGACKTRRAKGGIMIYDHKKKYAEYSSSYGEFIHFFSVDEKGKIGQCCGEIVLDDFISNIKNTHELIKI